MRRALRHAGCGLAAALILAQTAAGAAGNAPSTVGQVAESNGLSRNGILRVRTTSILRVEPGAAVPTDARAAIAQYDQLLELNPDRVLRAEALRRAADLRVQLADAAFAESGVIAQSDLHRAVAGYRRLLADEPAHPLADRVLYQLARAHHLLDDTEASIAALRQLGQDYPQSARAPEADFRAGELLFAQGRYAQAAPAYAALVARGADAPYFEHAQYKHAWALYKQADYAEAARAFLAILDRDLPAGTLEDPETALAAVPAARRERVSESLRVASLSFAALGGGPALSAHWAAQPSPSRFEVLGYAALGDTLLDKSRYTDAARAYAAMAERHPLHDHAPSFSARAIAALQRGGFQDAALDAQETFVARYAPDAAYWAGRTPDDHVLREVRQHLGTLAQHRHALAQASAPPARQAGFHAAALTYRRLLDLFPADPAAADTQVLYADALLESGAVRDAAQQYEVAAFERPVHPRAAEAALGALQAWQHLLRQSAAEPDAQADARRRSIEAALKLADRFPGHPQRARALLTAAEDAFALDRLDEAATLAARVLDAQPGAGLRRGAFAVIGDARFRQQRFADAEQAYLALVRSPDPAVQDRQPLIDMLATSIYRQAEAARDGGDPRAAAQHFSRVAQVAPQAALRASADYDAAMAWMTLEDWPAAARGFEQFRARHPAHTLAADADKQLALAYERDEQFAHAAEVLMRVSQRSTESVDTRRQAAWTAAQFYDRARRFEDSRHALAAYVTAYPLPLDPVMQARQRLAELARDVARDRAAERRWLEQIVQADASAGAARTAGSQRLAAQASLTIGRMDAELARSLPLLAPLEHSLAQRRTATERSVATLEQAAGYGYADITSAATYELAMVYGDLGQALIGSQRPPALSGEALEQYQILLEEQAFPFEEKALRAHEINLGRLRQGVWNDDIRRSATALGELAPGRYGKHDRRETSYDDLR